MQQLNVVQGTRALAAGFVVVSHGALWAAGFGPLMLPMRDLSLLGTVGVMMFFTISGFIMLHVSHGTFGNSGAPAAFLRRRIARVVPLYWLVTLLAAALVVKSTRALDLNYFMESLFFIPHVDAGRVTLPMLGVGWTLDYEMFFYALFAAALFLRRGLAILCFTLAALMAVGQMLHPIWDLRHSRNAIEFWTTPLLLPFLLGIGIAVLRKHAPWLRIQRPLLLLCCGIAAILALQDLLVPTGSNPAWWRVALPVDSAIVAAFAILAPSTIPVPAFMVLTGDASFSLYLVHPLLFGVADKLGGDSLGHFSPVLAVVFYLGLCIVAALGLYSMVERPLTRFCNRMLSGLGRKPEVQVSAA